MSNDWEYHEWRHQQRMLVRDYLYSSGFAHDISDSNIEVVKAKLSAMPVKEFASGMDYATCVGYYAFDMIEFAEQFEEQGYSKVRALEVLDAVLEHSPQGYLDARLRLCDSYFDRLIGLGANVNGRDELTGKTALHCAVEDGDKDKISRLVLAGADPSITADYDGEDLTALEVARSDVRQHIHDMVGYRRALEQHDQFERDTAAVLADDFNPIAAPDANAVPSDAEPATRRLRLRL